MNTNIEVLRELDELVEAARLLGVTQAKKLFGCHTDEDRRFERAMYESIDKHRAALLDWEGKQPTPQQPEARGGVEAEPPSAPVGVEAVRGAWLAAITLANNICVQESDRENDRDGDTGWINGTAECAKRIREYAHPTDAELLEMLDEAGANAAKAALSQQPAAPSGEAVAWLRMTPDGTPDWAEDCIGSDDRFLDPELASDGYYLQPLYTAPQQPAAVDEACAAAAIRFALTDPEGMTFLRLWNEGEFDTLRREWPDAPSAVYAGADPLATQHQEPTT